MRLDTTVIAYIKERYDDSVKFDGKIVSAEYDTVVKEYLQNEDGVLDLAYFLSNINSYFDEFQKYYARSGAYQEPGIDDFNYNWKVILDLFGIKYK